VPTIKTNLNEKNMTRGKQIKEAEELSVECNISMADALSLVIQSERNDILKRAFLVTDSDKNPTALEAIAMGLGMEDKGRGI
jgi:hypothetical protein|tara:strand:- start:9891 stop:10136 length:246 start_codon:yes stop_codon:yes gene_type:complete